MPPRNYLSELTDQYHWAQQASELEGFNLAMHAAWDSRIAMLKLPIGSSEASDSDNREALKEAFLVNQQLLGALAAHPGAPFLSAGSLRDIAVHADADAVRPGFAADALNDINTSYYSSAVAFEPEAGLASVYNDNQTINLALGHLLADALAEPGGHQGSHRTLRAKELCSGDNTAHWRTITKGAVAAGIAHLDVTLSDFFAPRIDPKARAKQNSIRAQVYSLFDTMPKLAADQRLDAIVTTYGFDSMWLPEDIHISKVREQWYQTLYRVKVADWQAQGSKLLEALRSGTALADATPADYDGIVVEEILEPFDMDAHPFKELLRSYPKQSFNIPGGLVRRVAESFGSQLGGHGMFVSCDMGDFGFTSGRVLRAHAKSGVAACYHPGEYMLAKAILESQYGLDVTLLSLQQLVEQYLGPRWRKKATKVEAYQIGRSPTNGVMVARRRR